MKKMSNTIRCDPMLKVKLGEIMSYREAVKLDKRRELSEREITRMMLNTDSWKNLENELKTKPRRKS